MEWREEILLWVEKMNPSLLIIDDVQIKLHEQKYVTLHADTEVLIIKGVDSVSYQEALDKGVSVLLVEENNAKISTFLSSESFKPHKNLYLSTLDKEQLFPILKKFVFKKVQEEGDLSEIIPYIGGMEMSFSEYRNLGKVILPNILSNLLHVEEYIDGRELASSLEGEGVIVCGSGISLESAIIEITKMHTRPYIISTGTSLPKLLEAGIIPDFFAAVDPAAPLKVLSSLENVSIPFFYQNRTSQDLLFAHGGVKIFMGSSRGWQIEDALMGEMGRENFFFDAGCNAGNFGVHTALSLGAKKVLLVGMDGVARDAEDGEMWVDGSRTRSDLYYGLDFFKTLQENFTDRRIEFYSGAIEIAAKKGRIDLPSPIKQDVMQAKNVIDRYFDHEMLPAVRIFLNRVRENSTPQQALAACLLAEFSLEPLYLHFMLPLWEVWKFLMPEAQDDFAKITFFYNLLKNFSEKTGYVEEQFFLFGKKEGEYLGYDGHKTLRERKYFYKGKEEGLNRVYDSGGRLLSVQNMKTGLRDGEYKVYSGDHLVRSGSFIDGRPHGEHLCFYDGRIMDQVCYEHGKKCGVHKKFSLDGYKRSEISYHKGGDFFDTYHFDGKGMKTYSAVWKKGVFTEERFDKGQKILSRRGKVEDGALVFEGER